MKIGELSERTGLPTSRIRYYETNGLIPAADRAPNGYRDYDASMIERLRMIDLAKSLGFSLEEIAALMSSSPGTRPSCETISAALEQKLIAIDAHMKRLRDTRKRVDSALRYLKENPGAEKHAENIRMQF
jgi:MerR family transcriptional regulator, copper efflux regulator